MAIFGTTGAGKTTLARNMIMWDIQFGHGVSVVDFHGDLISDILENHIPRERVNDVIYINPTDPTHTPSINILESERPEQRPLVVSHVIGIFKKLYAESWGTRLEDILRNSLFALMEQPQPVSLAAIPKLLTDPEYRQEVVSHVTNPIVRGFFEKNYDAWKNGFREEAISAVLNKIRAFLINPLLLAIIGQPRSSFNFRWAMDNKKIILVDLSKGTFGEDEAKLLGALIVTLENLAALSRADIPEEDRVLHFLYVDEAQNFITDFESTLSEARKYRLSLILITQGIQQLPQKSARAVFVNCATIATFRVDAEDAGELKKQFVMYDSASELQDMPNHTLYVRTLATDESIGETRPTGPHIVKTFPPFPRRKLEDSKYSTVVAKSREAYTQPRAEVELRIKRFLAQPNLLLN